MFTPYGALLCKTSSAGRQLGAVLNLNLPIIGKKHVTQHSVDAAIWSICDIMRRGNVASALQYVPELTWILFLRILDETEDREAQEADAVGAPHTPLPEDSLTAGRTGRRPPRRARSEAGPKRKELDDAGNKAFLDFVNADLIPAPEGAG